MIIRYMNFESGPLHAFFSVPSCLLSFPRFLLTLNEKQFSARRKKKKDKIALHQNKSSECWLAFHKHCPPICYE